jgi:hypothetical protein
VALSVEISGVGIPDIRLERDGVEIPGARSTTLYFPYLEARHAGVYRIAATSAATTTYSESFAIALEGPAQIATPPQATAAPQGGQTLLSVSATGSPPLTYQWRKGGAPIAGATAATFTRTATQPADAGSYDVVVTNAVGSVTSTPATLTVGQAPAIVFPPVSQTVPLTSVVGFSVAASGTAPLTYEWRKNGVLIPGATTASHVMNNLQAGDAGTYEVKVSNAFGSVTSGGVTLTLTPAVWFLAQPEARTAFSGMDVTFTAAAAGHAATPTYQWRKDGAVLPGATTASLTLTAVTPAAAGVYDVVATTSRGTATSATADSSGTVG